MGMKEQVEAIRARHESGEATDGDVRYLLAACEQSIEEFALWREKLDFVKAERDMWKESVLARSAVASAEAHAVRMVAIDMQAELLEIDWSEACASRCEECGASLAHVADSRGLAGVLCPECDRDVLGDDTEGGA